MKRIKYKFNGLSKSIPYSERALQTAELEADNNEYEVYEDNMQQVATYDDRITALEDAVLDIILEGEST